MTEKDLKMWQDDLDMISMLREQNEELEKQVAEMNKKIDICNAFLKEKIENRQKSQNFCTVETEKTK